jgi:hypothetical protein
MTLIKLTLQTYHPQALKGRGLALSRMTQTRVKDWGWNGATLMITQGLQMFGIRTKREHRRGLSPTSVGGIQRSCDDLTFHDEGEDNLTSKENNKS